MTIEEADAVVAPPQALPDPGPSAGLLYQGSDWDFNKLKNIHDAIAEIALGKLGLDIYPNQIEVISSEQMLDAYSSHGLPLMYRHWSFGKRFVRDQTLYRKGMQGLAYEIVINSSPCISYIMEENTMTMQALVIAHAAFGHNHFFKNNELFRQWTDAEGILDYLSFAKHYVQECEERHGRAAVDRILDAAHALEAQGAWRYLRKKKSLAEEKRRAEARREHFEQALDPIWTTLPALAQAKAMGRDEAAALENRVKARLGLPEENILYFIEKNAPKLYGWERELVRIVRTLSQYFYPQKQTKLMNEGCATFVHYEIMTELNEQGRISNGAYLEFLHAHSSVIAQPAFDSPVFSGWNPYALGFAMMRDIKRICLDPSDEDRAWFPSFAGNGEPYPTLRAAWANYRDESFILQFLSPKVIRDFRMFHLADESGEDVYKVGAIHDDAGYRMIRSKLSAHYDLSRREPDINVVDLDLMGDRRLYLSHAVHDKRKLERGAADKVVAHLRELWGYPVTLTERDAATDLDLRKIESSER
jgi:spore cortex formation protein SpoVR/YcgB (stage V sporulation)